MFEKFWKWLKSGEIIPTNKIPLQRRGEKFTGFKITLPWWGDKKDE